MDLETHKDICEALFYEIIEARNKLASICFLDDGKTSICSHTDFNIWWIRRDGIDFWGYQSTCKIYIVDTTQFTLLAELAQSDLYWLQIYGDKFIIGAYHGDCICFRLR